MVLKRLEECFDICHREAVPVLVEVQWSTLLQADASRRQRVGHRAFHDAVCLLLPRLAQHGEMQSGRAVADKSCSVSALGAREC